MRFCSPAGADDYDKDTDDKNNVGDAKDEVLFPHAPVLIAPHDLTTASSNVLLLQQILTPWQTEVFRSGNGFEQLCSSFQLLNCSIKLG